MENLLARSALPFDPQDVEHQALFFLTTFNPSEITANDIRSAVETQGAIVLDRIENVSKSFDVFHLFRGLTGGSRDLNRLDRLKMKGRDGKLYAVGNDGRSIDVEFKRIEDPEIIKLFTRDLHYIHQQRSEGETFGLFFAGDSLPWAVETVESSTMARGYKRAALAAHGIDPDNAVELTRLYTLPGCPLNAISILDKMVARHYRERGIDAMFTRTMPSYSKSKSTTIAGGMTEVLCTKELRHYFVESSADGGRTWIASSKRFIESNSDVRFRVTHEAFKLLPAVDVFMPLSRKCQNRTDSVPIGSAIHFPDTIPQRESLDLSACDVFQALLPRIDNSTVNA